MPGGYPGYAYPGMPGAGAQPQAGVYRPLDAVTIKAIVEALVGIGNKTAQDTLTQLISGKLKTDDDRAAAEAAMGAMVANLRPEYENMLFFILTAPEKVRPPEKTESRPGTAPGMQPSTYSSTTPGAYPGMYPGSSGSSGGKMTADDLQKRALVLVEGVASEQFRVRLAQHLVNPAIPEAQRILLGRFIMEERPENIPAQMVIHGSELLDPRAKTALEGYFAKFSSNAVAGILGIPPEQTSGRQSGQPYGQYGQPQMGPQPGQPAQPAQPGEQRGSSFGLGSSPVSGASSTPGYGSSMPGYSSPMPGTGMYPPVSGMTAPGMTAPDAKKPFRPDPDLPYRLARVLWAPNVATPLLKRLEDVESLEKDAPQILWASTVPLDPMRTKVYGTLRRHWETGPKALMASGMLEGVISEPGFLFVMKSLPRKDPPVNWTPSGGSGSGTSSMPMQPGADPSGRGDSGRLKGAKVGAAAEKMKAKAEKIQLDAEWMTATEHLVRTYCRRLYLAAKAARKTGKTADESGREGMPVDVPPDAQVAAEFHFDWPGDGQQKLSGISLDPIKVHYVRILDRTTPRKAATLFKRKMVSEADHRSDFGMWLETWRTMPNTDQKQSIDIVVTRAKDMAAKAGTGSGAGAYPSGAPGMAAPSGGMYPSGPTSSAVGPAGRGAALAPDEATDLVIEVLTMEMKAIDEGADQETKPGKRKKKPADE